MTDIKKAVTSKTSLGKKQDIFLHSLLNSAKRFRALKMTRTVIEKDQEGHKRRKKHAVNNKDG